MSTERFLRGVLWGVAAALCLGIPVELALGEHWHEPAQLIPFGLSALGLVAIALGALVPRRPTLIGARVVMVLLALGGLFGTFEHFEHNAEFHAEIQPEAGTPEVLLAGLTGANPLLAPGIFVVVAVLGLAATMRR